MKPFFALLIICFFSQKLWAQASYRLDGKWQVEKVLKEDTVLFPLDGTVMIVYLEKNLIRFPFGLNECMTNISYDQDSLEVVSGLGCTLVGEPEPDEIYQHYWYSGKYTLFDNDSSLTFEKINGKVLLRKLE